jgi:hypothetical protein
MPKRTHIKTADTPAMLLSNTTDMKGSFYTASESERSVPTMNSGWTVVQGAKGIWTLDKHMYDSIVLNWIMPTTLKNNIGNHQAGRTLDQ